MFSFRDKSCWQPCIGAILAGSLVELDREFYNYWVGHLDLVWENRDLRLPDGELIIANGYHVASQGGRILAFWSVRHGPKLRHFCWRTREVALPIHRNGV